jgi:multiple sugar transport system ATP-binding protein
MPIPSCPCVTNGRVSDVAAVRYDGVLKRFDDGTVAVRDLNLEIQDGEFMILVGPSGCGKTTALRMLAGLEDATEGTITLGSQVVNDIDPGRRDVAMVFQSYALFPHMTVFDNMAFPLRMRRFRKQEVASAVRDAAGLLGLEELLDRRPNQLSGGQRQRVAMGRAIVRHPQVYLMDEPLSNLDAKLRAQMRAELAKLHRRLGVTTIYVTHDQTEAMTLGSRVAVMSGGLVQQVGRPQELYRRPANTFVARFIGSPTMNLMPARVAGGRLVVAGAPDAAGVDVSGRWPGGEREVVVGVRPETWKLGSAEPAGDEIVVRGEVEVVEDLGAESIVYFKPEIVEVEATAIDDDGQSGGAFAARVEGGARIQPGDRLALRAPAASLHLFDAASGDALSPHENGR